MVPLVTSSIGDSELIIHFQEAKAMLFPNCYNKQGIQSNLPSYTPMNQGPIFAKVYPEGIQPLKGNNCGLIPTSADFMFKTGGSTVCRKEEVDMSEHRQP